ncbi:unnamed protein product [Caenorhabditis sp. 36 PRJEB53466]|nr:unnamed protein product [Caenorhabditis sp. 36 PRJEB53466]
MQSRNTSVDKVSHELVRKYTAQPLKFAYYEHFVATPPMRQSRRASMANRILTALIIIASLVLLFYRSSLTFSQEDKACIQDEWHENSSVESTLDFGSTYRISFADVQNNYTWLYVPKIRTEEKTEILMIVISNCDNFARRNVLRKTWMSSGNSKIVAGGTMKALFLVGSIKGNERLNEVVMDEARLFGDVIVADTEDDYVGLPFKTITALLFALRFPSVQLIGKIDEDVLFFPDQLTTLFHDGTINTNTSMLYGYAYEAGVTVNHGEDGGKWSVPMSSFKCTVYPSYLGGPLYFATKKAAERIVKATKHRKFISVEDVFITGLLAGDVGVHKKHLPCIYNVAAATNDRETSEILGWHTNKNNEKYTEAFKTMRYTRCSACSPKNATIS